MTTPTVSMQIASQVSREAVARRRRVGVMQDFPAGDWEEELVVHKFRRNRDGTLTMECRIVVHGDGLESWDDVRKIRLPKGKSNVR